MPEYIPEAHIPEPGDPVDAFTMAYLEAAEWCGIDEEQCDAFRNAEDPRWSEDAVAKAQEDCQDFRQLASAFLEGIDDAQAGHDFWLTRNGHGAGFWDRGQGS